MNGRAEGAEMSADRAPSDDPVAGELPTPPPRPADEQIAEILANFDFAKAGRVMHFLDWRLPGATGQPTADDLRRHAAGLLRSVAAGRLDDLQSGPFEVENRGGVLRLLFVVEEWDGL
jgi:hypothetical protein